MVYHIAGGFRDDGILDADPYIEVIEGDVANIELVDSSPDEGRLINKKGWTVGRQMKSDGMPTKVRRGGYSVAQRPLVDVESFYGQFLINAKVRDIIETFEPGRHQFFEMDLYVGDEFQRSDYFFNICNRLDTTHPEKTFPRNARGFYSPVRDEPSALVFSVQAIGAYHAWRDKFTQGAFISDELANALKGNDITGLSYLHHEQC